MAASISAASAETHCTQQQLDRMELAVARIGRTLETKSEVVLSSHGLGVMVSLKRTSKADNRYVIIDCDEDDGTYHLFLKNSYDDKSGTDAATLMVRMAALLNDESSEVIHDMMFRCFYHLTMNKTKPGEKRKVYTWRNGGLIDTRTHRRPLSQGVYIECSKAPNERETTFFLYRIVD